MQQFNDYSINQNLVVNILSYFFCYSITLSSVSKNPGPTITIIFDFINNLYNMLLNYEIDLAVVEGKIQDLGINSLLLDTDSLMLVVSNNNPLAKKVNKGYSMFHLIPGDEYNEGLKQLETDVLPGNFSRRVVTHFKYSISLEIHIFNKLVNGCIIWLPSVRGGIYIATYDISADKVLYINPRTVGIIFLPCIIYC